MNSGSVCFVISTFIVMATVVRGCVVNSKTTDGTPSFVNEVSFAEIVRIGDAERLDCVAVNFCNITWYKDGVPFPWLPSEEVDNHYLDDKGQFLYFNRAGFGDRGAYKCVVSDGEVQITRTVRLIVLEAHNPPPRLLGDGGGACADKYAKIGETVTFTCWFNVGNKDEISPPSIGWLKVMPETGDVMPVEALDSRDFEISTKQRRSNDSVIYSDLEISNISEKAFGAWKVYAYNGYQVEHQLNLTVRKPPTIKGATGAKRGPVNGGNVLKVTECKNYWLWLWLWLWLLLCCFKGLATT